MIMEINYILHGDIIQINLDGHLDATTSIKADSEFTRMIDEGNTKLLVELSKLDYISSAGLRVLLVAAKQLQQKGGKIVLCSMTTGVKEVFEISGFSSIFKIFPTVEEALEFMQP
jgi:anti-anti-sigma factor